MAKVQYISDEQGNQISIIIPIEFWRKIEAESETARSLKDIERNEGNSGDIGAVPTTLRPPTSRFGLQRFVTGQELIYPQVLSELRAGQKISHWMWFIFPQIDGLGSSPTAKLYAIKSLEEAREYLKHPILGPRLLECSQLVLGHQGRPALSIFGLVDALKLKSSMTLFLSAAEPGSVFEKVLDAFFQGQRDEKTLELLKRS